MYELYVPTTTFQEIDTTLPMLPGEVGPATSTTVLRSEDTQTPCTETVTFERVVFPPLTPVFESEVEVEELRTMILERPEEPYADWTKARLYKRAKELGMPGRSKLNKTQLRQALITFEGR